MNMNNKQHQMMSQQHLNQLLMMVRGIMNIKG